MSYKNENACFVDSLIVSLGSFFDLLCVGDGGGADGVAGVSSFFSFVVSVVVVSAVFMSEFNVNYICKLQYL
jgi:hypothetical protein